MSEATFSATAGWREWVALPELGLSRIKAKLDTGARSSALHAWDIEVVEHDGRAFADFNMHPLHRSDEAVVRCRAPLVDRRIVKSSTGNRTRRWVINTEIAIGEFRWPTEVTLVNRKDMMFRLLLGRTALRGRFLIDSQRSYLLTQKRNARARAQ